MDTNPKRVLFLDDDKGRADCFRRNHSRRQDLKIVWVETSLEAILCFKEHHWDIVMLDHDLGELGNSSGLNPGCGMDVVDWMVDNLTGDVPKPELVVVHSWNPTRAPEMAARLRDQDFNVVQVPFEHDMKLS